MRWDAIEWRSRSRSRPGWRNRLARNTAKNRSQLFREMFELYRQSQDEEAFRSLQRYGRRKARERGILTERDVERLVFEDR